MSREIVGGSKEGKAEAARILAAAPTPKHAEDFKTSPLYIFLTTGQQEFIVPIIEATEEEE